MSRAQLAKRKGLHSIKIRKKEAAGLILLGGGKPTPNDRLWSSTPESASVSPCEPGHVASQGLSRAWQGSSELPLQKEKLSLASPGMSMRARGRASHTWGARWASCGCHAANCACARSSCSHPGCVNKSRNEDLSHPLAQKHPNMVTGRIAVSPARLDGSSVEVQAWKWLRQGCGTCAQPGFCRTPHWGDAAATPPPQHIQAESPGGTAWVP